MDAATPVFVIGDRVIAVYHAYEGGGRGYRGIVAVVEGNDKYTVRYDDQDVESGVHARFITPAKKRMYSNMSPEEQAKKKKKVQIISAPPWLIRSKVKPTGKTGKVKLRKLRPLKLV